MSGETGEGFRIKPDVYHTARSVSDVRRYDVAPASRSYARAGVRSDFEKYGLFTLFFARKRCMHFNEFAYAFGTARTRKANRRCLASPKKVWETFLVE